MADLYRKSSLEKLSNPEQLDRMIKISSPLSWLALVAVLLIIAATVTWSIVGTLPTTETVNGIIVDPANVNAVYADAAGTMEKYYLDIGKEVKQGDKIAQIKLSDDTKKDILAKQDGVLSAYSIAPTGADQKGNPIYEGAQVLTGTEVARITPKDAGSQVVVCYVPLMSAQKFKTGMEVLVYPGSVDSQKYGHMEAKIVSVEEYATNTSSLAYVLGSGNGLAEQFAANGPIVEVVCELKTDSATKSGFHWTSESAKNLTVSNGTIVSAKIVVDECAPITKLIDIFKDDAEG